MIRFIGALCGAALALTWTAPASGAKYIITYKGFASDAFDPAGVFSALGGNINGMAFEAIYTLDTAASGSIYFEAPNASEYYGGSRQGPGVANPLTAVLKIGSFTLNLGSTGSFFGSSFQLNDTVDEVKHGVVVDRVDSPFRDLSMSHMIRSKNFNILNGVDQSQPLSYTVQVGDFVFSPGDAAEGLFQDVEYDAFGQEIRFSAVNLIPESVSIAPLAANAVPEPATWAMMIAGFGLIGAAARARGRGKGRNAALHSRLARPA